MIGESRLCFPLAAFVKRVNPSLYESSPHQFAKGVSGTNRVSSIGDITVLLDSIL